MPEANHIRQKIVDASWDGDSLWGLTAVWHQRMGGEMTEVYPATTIEEIQPALVAFLEEGIVDLWTGWQEELLSTDEALRVACNPANYDPRTAEREYCVWNRKLRESD